MGVLDLWDRVNWQQAARLLCCSKSQFFRLVQDGKIPAYGNEERGRFYLKSDIAQFLERYKRQSERKKKRGKK